MEMLRRLAERMGLRVGFDRDDMDAHGFGCDRTHRSDRARLCITVANPDPMDADPAMLQVEVSRHQIVGAGVSLRFDPPACLALTVRLPRRTVHVGLHRMYGKRWDAVKWLIGGAGVYSYEEAPPTKPRWPIIGIGVTLSAPHVAVGELPSVTWVARLDRDVRDRTPWWQHSDVRPLDHLLGPITCESKVVRREKVTVTLPEGDYDGEAYVTELTYSRPRWPRKSTKYVTTIDFPDSIPESGHRPGADLCGRTIAGKSIDRAIASLVDKITEYRGGARPPARHQGARA